MFTTKFVKDTAERAIKTFAQALLAGITVGSAITDIDWASGASIAATAAVYSLITSVISSSIGKPDTASAVDNR